MTDRARHLLATTVVLAVAASPIAVPPPAWAAAQVSTYGDLQREVGPGCVQGSTVELAGPILAPDNGLETLCRVTIDLAGHDLTLRVVRIDDGTTLTVTDSSEEGGQDDAPGALTALGNAIAAPGISTAGAALAVTGRAEVEAHGSNAAAGIGGAIFEAGGALSVTDDAVVTATGGVDGAGVGGGRNGAGGTTEVSGGGRLIATGGDYAAGIGGGQNAAGGTTTIIGGGVDATGGVSAAGIGGGSSGQAGQTSILGDAVVRATAGIDGAGIGGGSLGSGGVTSISGDATVEAYGDSNADPDGSGGGAGIGSGSGGGDGGDITLGGSSQVTASGGLDGGAGIGGGNSASGGNITVEDDANVFAGGGSGGAGVGGGVLGDGGVVVVDGNGGRARLTAAAGSAGASAVGTGSTETSSDVGFGSLSVDDGSVNIPYGTLWLDQGDGAEPEITIGEDGVIESRAPVFGAPTDEGAPAEGALRSDGGTNAHGRVLNRGAITLVTGNVDPDLVIVEHDYLVTFDAQRGALAPGAESPVEVFAESFDAGERDFPADPTRQGFRFDGWNSEADGSGAAITATSTLPGASDGSGPEPITAYAQWTRTSSDNPTPDPPGPAPTVDADIDGTPKVGRVLLAETGPAASGVTYTFQWLRDGEPIAGATGKRYRPTRADVARRVNVVVTATGARGRSSSDTSRAVAVRPAVGIVGTPRVGQELTPRVFVPAGARATYAWQTSERPRRGQQRMWREVGTGASYTLRADDAGTRVRLVVTITGDGFSRVVSYSNGRFVRR